MHGRIFGAALVALAAFSVQLSPATAAVPTSHYSVDPTGVRALIAPASAGAIDITPSDCLASFGYACQTADSIRAAYDIPDTVKGVPAGTGQSITIVTAFGSPTIASDLAEFNDDFALPATKLNVLYPGRPTRFDATDDNQLSWALETSLDVEWAHAVAPGATINLVVAASDANDDIYAAEQYAFSRRLSSIVSLSYGEPEALIGRWGGTQLKEHALYQQAAASGIAVIAAAGDNGSDFGFGKANAAYPASDPFVTAVGGTSLFKGLDLKGAQETVWGDYSNCPLGCVDGAYGATGGAPSLLTGKAGNDVAFDASTYTGYIVEAGFYPNPDDDGTYFVGGTSAAAPAWAGIVAILNQAKGSSLGSIQDDLASWSRAGGIADITSGDNETPSFLRGFSATRGWDVPTGYGVPDVAKLLSAVSPHGLSFGWKAFSPSFTKLGRGAFPSAWPGLGYSTWAGNPWGNHWRSVH